MKKLLLALCLTGCAGMSLSQDPESGDTTITDPESGAQVTIPQSEDPEANAWGQAIGTIITLGTGNPAAGAGAAALIGAGALYVRKRRKK